MQRVSTLVSHADTGTSVPYAEAIIDPRHALKVAGEPEVIRMVEDLRGLQWELPTLQKAPSPINLLVLTELLWQYPDKEVAVYLSW